MLLCKIKKLDVYCSRHLRSWFCGILLFWTRSGDLPCHRLGCFDGCSKLFVHLFLYGMVAGAGEFVSRKDILPENEKQAATALDKFIEKKKVLKEIRCKNQSCQRMQPVCRKLLKFRERIIIEPASQKWPTRILIGKNL